MFSRQLGAQDLNASDVNPAQNNPQGLHTKFKSADYFHPEISVDAGCGINEPASKFRTKKRRDAKEHKAEKLKESAKINSECFDEDVPSWRPGWYCPIADF